jgi:hypothetical protein
MRKPIIECSQKHKKMFAGTMPQLYQVEILQDGDLMQLEIQ